MKIWQKIEERLCYVTICCTKRDNVSNIIKKIYKSNLGKFLREALTPVS
ncbi:unnamed protein product, partial [Callosobruchus maculatus]